MYLDKKKDTTNIGAFFQTCKVNGNYIDRLIGQGILRWELIGCANPFFLEGKLLTGSLSVTPALSELNSHGFDIMASRRPPMSANKFVSYAIIKQLSFTNWRRSAIVSEIVWQRMYRWITGPLSFANQPETDRLRQHHFTQCSRNARDFRSCLLSVSNQLSN